MAQAEKKRPSSTEEIVIQGPRRSPDKNLFGWHEYRSQHFLVDSDLSTSKVEGLIEKLESLRAVELDSLVDEPVVIPGRVRVIASRLSLVRDELARDEYFTGSGRGCQLLNITCRQLAEDEANVGFVPFGVGKCSKDLLLAANYFVSRLGEPTIVLPVLGLRVNSEVVAHELAHYLAAVLFLHPPPWFREGFATFVQTVGGEVLENAPPTGSHILRGERFVSG
ncbi:MAG TPA: hypothetical protein VKE49_04715, partial [Myxococcaceae bacterium]|nr:hypothetical protein [Myxococcaceae bacterium]